MTQSYDIIIFGGGIAGLFIANRLRRAGYSLIVIEKGALGGVQTLASQGMIHGGQKYTLQGNVTAQASSIAAMPERWDACFEGHGRYRSFRREISKRYAGDVSGPIIFIIIFASVAPDSFRRRQSR